MDNAEFFLAQNAKGDFIRYDEDIFALYSDLPSSDLQKILASIHTQINESFRTMNNDLQKSYDDEGNPVYSGGYFHAQDSRDLLERIERLERIRSRLSKTRYAFSIRAEYADRIRQCKRFVAQYRGSTIPDDLQPLEIIDVAPIFIISSSVPVTKSVETIYAQMQPIGGGSYADVYSYTDPFNGLKIALKRAKPDLEDKELLRFRQEFDTLKSLHSPYIIDVYSFNDAKNEYTMEYMDETIFDFIGKRNPSLSLNNRKRIIGQICRGLDYLHSKGYLHRDISLKNVMVKLYEDTEIVKICDFGLVKVPQSALTSLGSEIKGSLNDPDLVNVGFGHYEMRHETYALTRLCFFILTGKTNIDKQKEGRIKQFWRKGTSTKLADRFSTVDELWEVVKLLEQE